MTKFKGCVLFSSINQMNFKKTQPRDDLHALCYVLIFLLNHGSPPFKYDKGRSLFERFNTILRLKTETSVAKLCDGEACKPLLPLVSAVFSLDAVDTPNYMLYKHYLIECMHEISITGKFSTASTSLNCSSLMADSSKNDTFAGSPAWRHFQSEQNGSSKALC